MNLGSSGEYDNHWNTGVNFIPSKIVTMVPDFAVEDLTLGRTPALVPKFAVKDLPLGRTL